MANEWMGGKGWIDREVGKKSYLLFSFLRAFYTPRQVERKANNKSSRVELFKLKRNRKPFLLSFVLVSSFSTSTQL